MRALGWILLGLLVGALAALSAANALQAAGALNRGVMNMMKYHLGEARKVLTAEQCSQPPTQHFEALAVLGRDVGPIYLPIGERDELFDQYTKDLVEATAAAAAGNSDCAQASERLALIGDACQACHRDFK